MLPANQIAGLQDIIGSPISREQRESIFCLWVKIHRSGRDQVHLSMPKILQNDKSAMSQE